MKEKRTMRLAAVFACSIALVALGLLAGCAGKSANDEITVISREAGSGTRSAFVELFGIEESVNGRKVDATTETADITNSTEVVITAVRGNSQAIGYISLGSLNDEVKALTIDGAAASAENIKAGVYPISRPFNIVTKAGRLSSVAEDFISFILSAEGQRIIEENGYIAVSSAPAEYSPVGIDGVSGAAAKVTVAGSSSVYPVMEKLAEAYSGVNPSINVEVQQSDSTTGVNSALEEICDIGMASRDVREAEIASGAVPQVIAFDGIAVIVNKENARSDISREAVRRIYTGDITEWSAIAE